VPTYAYLCTACEHRFEIVQSFSDDSLTECPQCQGRLRKLFNAVGVVFKGSGFYRNDSRNDSRNGSRRVIDKDSRSGAGKDSHQGSDSASVPANSSESGSSSADSSSSTSSDSAASTSTTKTATKSKGAAA
jgi:putative FmdB family regulatory protein